MIPGAELGVFLAGHQSDLQLLINFFCAELFITGKMTHSARIRAITLTLIS